MEVNPIQLIPCKIQIRQIKNKLKIKNSDFNLIYFFYTNFKKFNQIPIQKVISKNLLYKK